MKRAFRARRAALRGVSLALMTLSACKAGAPKGEQEEKKMVGVRSAEHVSKAACAAPSPGKAGAPIQYIVEFPRAAQHYAHVSATVPTDGRDEITVMMAVWTPGSYLVREYQRHIEGLVATTQSGEPLTLDKISKNRWAVQTEGADQVLLSYELYCHEMSVRTNWVDNEFALINGAPTFLTLVDGHEREHHVRMSPPRAWRNVLTGLPSFKDSKLHFRAENFDALVDSPFLLGSPEINEFEAGKAKHIFADIGGGKIWDSERAARDTQRLVEEEHAFWGTVPYDEYTFMNLLTETYGGLEHKNSTVMMFPRFGGRERESYLNWLGLTAHEFFHTWNVKRLRPVALGPFDYENEVYTESMWIAEGITSYYDDLTVHRAGLSTEDEYLAALSKSIDKVMSGPGRLVQSLTLSSFDAWVKLYRRDENFANSAVNYYTKGALVAWLLDAKIRASTDGAKSLDDVMVAAYDKFSGACGYTDEEFRALVGSVAGVDLQAWLEGHLEGVEDLDFSEAFAYFGLRFKSHESKEKKGPQKDDPWFGQLPPQLGVTMNGPLVESVVAGLPAFDGGINAGDELIALDGYRVEAGKLDERLARYRPQETLEVLLSRRGEILSRTVTLAEPQAHPWAVEIDPDAEEFCATRRAAWLASKRAQQ